MKSIFFVLLTVFNFSAHAGFAETWNEAWQKKVYDTQNGYAETEVPETAALLNAGSSSILCGYASPGVWASSSLRYMLKQLTAKVGATFDASLPAIYGDSTVCVTVTPKK